MWISSRRWSLDRIVVHSCLMSIKLASWVIKCYIDNHWLLLRCIVFLLVFTNLLIHIASCTIDDASLRDPIIWIVVWILILSRENLLFLRLLSGLIRRRKICDISTLKLTIRLMRLVIFSLILIHNLALSKIIWILNMLLILLMAGIHIVCHVYSCTWQEACGFVHHLLVLTSGIFLLVLAHLLFWILNMALVHHMRMSRKTISTSTLWVWVSIACGSHVNVLFVVELIVIQILIIIVPNVLNNLWLERMIHLLDHLLRRNILAWLLREEILCESLIFWHNAIGSSSAICFVNLKMVWSWSRSHILVISIRLLLVWQHILLITVTKVTASRFFFYMKTLNLLLVHTHIIVCFLHLLFIIFLLKRNWVEILF